MTAKCTTHVHQECVGDMTSISVFIVIASFATVFGLCSQCVMGGLPVFVGRYSSLIRPMNCWELMAFDKSSSLNLSLFTNFSVKLSQDSGRECDRANLKVSSSILYL